VPAQEYGNIFSDFTSNPWLPTLWLYVFIALSHFVITRGVQSGIEKFSKIMMPTLFIIVVLLVICSVTLPGAGDGIRFMLVPDFSKVTSGIILQAMGQAFFSLSLAMGCLCTYASYFGSNTKLATTAINVSVIDTIVAVIAGFIIFPSIFNIGINPNEVEAGASLTFISLPNVFQKAFGNGSFLAAIFSMTFYFLLFVAALTSAVSLHEVATAYMTEEFKMSRKAGATIVTITITILGTLCSLSFGPLDGVRLFGRNIFTLFDDFSGTILLPVGGLLTSIFAGWVLDQKLYRDELSNHGELKASYFKLLVFSLRYITPVAIGLVFLNQLGVINFI
jgi:NSS family neurotransmitter:Na+ symporter